MEPCGRLAVEFQQAATLVAASLFLRVVVLNEDDPGTLGKLAHDRREVEVLVIHHEAEDAAASAAPEAVEGLARWVHMERGAFLLVERAERPVTRPRALQREVAADDLHDVAGIGDFLNALFGDAGHGS